MLASPRTARRPWRLAAAALALAVLFGGPAAARSEVLVFAAASLTEVSTALAQAFTAGSGEEVTLSFGSSSTLARQIAEGAPADVYLSANREWVDYLVGAAGWGGVRELFGNRLVIVAPASAEGAAVRLANLPEALGGGRLAVGDPEHVPAGQYARQAMQAAGLWTVLEPMLAPADDARAALRLVERGAAPYGIVYETDARAGDVVVAGNIDPALHAPVAYYLALPPEPGAAATAFAAFLAGPEAADIAARFGFSPAGAGSP